MLLYPSASMCYNAKRCSARINGPFFHGVKKRDWSVKYSYWNPASLRWHLYSLTQTLQVITWANDFEEFTRFSRVSQSLHACPAYPEPGAQSSVPWPRQDSRVAFFCILKQHWDVTTPVCLPGPWQCSPGPVPGMETMDIVSKRGGEYIFKSIYMYMLLLSIKTKIQKGRLSNTEDKPVQRQLLHSWILSLCESFPPHLDGKTTFSVLKH